MACITITTINVMLAAKGRANKQLLKSFFVEREGASLITPWKLSLNFQAAAKETAYTIQNARKTIPTLGWIGMPTGR